MKWNEGNLADERCIYCGTEFTKREWKKRHVAYYDQWAHEACCLREGECAPPILGPPNPPRCEYNKGAPSGSMFCSKIIDHDGEHDLYMGIFTSSSVVGYIAYDLPSPNEASQSED